MRPPPDPDDTTLKEDLADVMDEAAMEVRATLGDHIEELRGCLFHCLLLILAVGAACGIFYSHILEFFTRPTYQAFDIANVPPEMQKLSSDMMGVFFSIVKSVLVVAVVLSLPLVIRRIWQFVRPGLHDHEVSVIRPIFFLGGLFFLAGAALAYAVISPIGQAWFLTLNDGTNIETFLWVNQSIDFTTMMMLVFGAAFETPLVIVGLVRTGVLEVDTLRKHRRHVILAAAVLGAFFTPPDVFTQITLAGSFVVLFELGILMASFSAKKTEEEDA